MNKIKWPSMRQRQSDHACCIFLFGKYSPLHLPLLPLKWQEAAKVRQWHPLSGSPETCCIADHVFFDRSVFISSNNPRHLTVIYEIDLVQAYTAENLFGQFLWLLCLSEPRRKAEFNFNWTTRFTLLNTKHITSWLQLTSFCFHISH